MNKNNGGPAFPGIKREYAKVGPNYADIPHAGMTLRDYFAAKAIQGFCTVEKAWKADPGQLAKSAYLLADAMLAARGDA